MDMNSVSAIQLVMAIMLFYVVLMVVAYIRYFVEHKKMRNFVKLFVNGMAGNALSYRAWAGDTVPRFDITIADNEYWRPSPELVLSLVPRCHTIMIERGYDEHSYVPDRQDCDDYAECRCTVMHDLLRDASVNIPEAQKKGIPTFRFSFTTDKGGRHRIAGVLTTEGDLHFEMFPTTANEQPRKMSDKELASGYKII